jgi:hypothetical protein
VINVLRGPGNYIAYREEEVRDAWLDAVDAQVRLLCMCSTGVNRKFAGQQHLTMLTLES